MSADEQSNPGEHWPRELTPEEAAKLRAHHLALARETAASNRDPDRGDNESTDATVAAFILPGD
jgi:hypothetical protein